MDMKRRILSCFLAFCMIFALLPAPAQAAGNAENATPTVTATVQHAETGQITAQIEAYMTDSANKTRTVKPCDIIFLIEQSKFMNTQNGSASSGDERAEILGAIDRLLDGMPQPTTGGEHRIAIAGYGRINNYGIGDTYDATLYPGKPSDNNDSLNTGYYTKDKDGKADFHSQSGWTEWNQIDGHNDATLPKLPSGYLTNTDGTDGYDNVFLSVDDAKQVIDADTMVPWHAGAARMDAGLTITERLAEIAKAEPDGEDRNLIVCIAASSLPYQNSGTYQKLRPDAAIAAANTLKTTYGATIFGLGDFNKLTLESGNPLNDPDKQRDFFNDTMASICGNTSAHGADYFKGLSQVHDIDEALNELMTKIDANVGEGAAEELSINVDSFTEGKDSYSWSQLKDVHHILSAGSIREVASVDYYRFTGYDDSNGTPKFESTPSRHTEQSLADIGRGNAIQTSLNILPIPPQAQAGEIRGANYGEKVVITITDPVCIDYEWIGRWTPPKLAPPKHEHAARGTTHKPAAPTQNAVAVDDLNLKFDGWYRLWDETIDQGKPTWTYNGKTYVKYAGTVFPAFGSDLKLYGRWLPEIQVSFHWAGSVVPVDGDGNKIAAPSALSLSLDGDGTCHYQATAPTADGFEFDGWYKDSDCTQKFQEGGEVLTANTDLYGRWTRLGTKTVTFKVQNGKWSNDKAEDKTVTVELRNGLGTLSPADVPTGMTPVDANEYKAPGAWDSHPNTNTDGISETGNYVYTYTFPQKDKCTVTYHWLSTENPDSAFLPPQATVTEGTSYPVATVDPVDGWTFSGWYNSEGTSVTEVKYSSAGQNIDLYGRWTHADCTVTFLADDKEAEHGFLNADGQTVSTYTVPYGSTLQNAGQSLPTPVPDEENKWFFKDWDLKEDSSNNPFYTDPDVLNMPVRSNLTFVAQWWPVVTFDANGGAWRSGEAMRYAKIQTDTKTVAAASTPVRNGYTFLGWYTAADGGDRANFEDTVNRPTTLYAHWAKNAAVTFRIVNGTWSGGAAEDKTVTVVLYPQADGTASGTLDASYVPQIMLPAPGYENIAGGWEQTPNTDPNGITGDVTYVYRFGSTGGGSSSGHSTRYTLHYESNGGTAYKDERCSSGTKVTLDKTPTRESYTFTGWYADKALTQKITSVTMNSDKTVYAGWEATGVPDKLNGDDHFAYVIGYPDGKVHPEGNISRAEVATIFFRLLKSDIRDGNLIADNDFSDVSDGQWYNKAVSTMAKLGIVKGRRADRFDPDASITRAEFAAICARFNTKPVKNSSSFSDISGHWAENEIERAAAFGWISGYPDGTFRPDARITRAEAMTMINRVLCRMPQSKSDLLDSMVTWPDNKPSDWHYLAVQEATNSHDFDRQGEVGESWTKLTSVPDWTRYQ